ncbi:MAG: hypothetical protein U0169_24855 [Polyangiaceae bacterium]
MRADPGAARDEFRERRLGSDREGGHEPHAGDDDGVVGKDANHALPSRTLSITFTMSPKVTAARRASSGTDLERVLHVRRDFDDVEGREPSSADGVVSDKASAGRATVAATIVRRRSNVVADM